MNPAHWLYRTRQFWLALRNQPVQEDFMQAQAVLTRPQMELFLRLQPSEQTHSLSVFRALQAQGEASPDGCNREILVAALLHDVGKSRFSLHLWERVLIVLGRAIFPRQVVRWGRLAGTSRKDHTGLRRAFIVAEQHPLWGAEMAAAAGASPLAITLIRRHQDRLSPTMTVDASLEERLLRTLQAVDDES
jgi:HD superfamily phosphohydrolase